MGTRRTHVLELAVLGLLDAAPLHGYELRKRLAQELGTLRTFSYGSLYPCLRRLLDEGLVTQTPDGSGPSRGRRSRIVYRLTGAGRDRLDRLLSEVGPAACDDECFGVHFALFGRTRADVRVRILEARRDRLRRQLDHANQRLDQVAGRCDGYLFELNRHSVESVEREVHWLDDLIDRERRGPEGAATLGGRTDPGQPGSAPPARPQ
ncbi:PadR family transcriptional regulator [Marinactinospora thermotolerans]|uniref:Transcriptional regulator, PadR family n=1 Tax=Marinactinospora thermotolerans DSM 45154 TaxID=1122192 RepID=A0A1T4RD49_9ACTN|nr:PadR family transcriptional regulator [Marinactinospora thermotolerans]SKA13829.1 transcriptional regulator, PadR family [Marinactinospora thermotolerans DSM 45154]